MPLISVTRLKLRNFFYLPRLIPFSLRSTWQAKRAAGNLGVKLLQDRNLAFWTCTAWTDEGAMRQFMKADAHGQAMTKLMDWCSEASVVHWQQDQPELPDWQEAYRRMITEGRPSKVRHPSAAHQSFQVDPPRQA